MIQLQGTPSTSPLTKTLTSKPLSERKKSTRGYGPLRLIILHSLQVKQALIPGALPLTSHSYTLRPHITQYKLYTYAYDIIYTHPGACVIISPPWLPWFLDDHPSRVCVRWFLQVSQGDACGHQGEAGYQPYK